MTQSDHVEVQAFTSFGDLRRAFGLQDASLLASTTESTDVFYTLPWFETLAEFGLTHGADASMARHLLLLASSAPSGARICLPLRTGRTLTALSNYYSCLYGPITWTPNAPWSPDQQEDQTLWNAVCEHLRNDRSRWPHITLSPLDAEAPFYKNVRAGLKQAGYWVDDYFCFGNWYLQVAGRPFSAYFQGLPSALRHTIERGQRRLAKHGVWSITIQQAADDRLDAAIADFVQVYMRSWKGPEPNPMFIPGLARMAAAQGWLRLGILTLDGQAIAAQLWLVKTGKASIYKLAYTSGFERFSAGSVLTCAIMQHVIDVDQVKEVDYLTGDEAYKRDWMSHRRERRGIVAFNPGTVRGLWGAGRHFVGVLVAMARRGLHRR